MFPKRIRKYEHLSATDDIPMLIKTVFEMEKYEVAFEGITRREWYYDRNRDELRKELDCKLKKEVFARKLVKKDQKKP